MKFGHMADCHIGAWRDPKLSELPIKAFKSAILVCIQEKVDFILISGDLFNTAIPGIDKIKTTTKVLHELRNYNIPVYIIPGSHDFSPSGKTMLDVLEEAGLCINVVKGNVVHDKLQLSFTMDKSGAKITGMLGLRNTLEKNHYDKLDRGNLESEQGFKIFMFHSALSELKPEKLAKMESSPISLLPKNFDYYAGGHVHIVQNQSLPGYKNIVYPGPLFPNSFSELQELKNGGFYIYDNGDIIRKDITLHPVINISLNCNRRAPEEIIADIHNKINQINPGDAIVLLHLFGQLGSGKITDLNFKQIIEILYQKHAYFVLKNSAGLRTIDFQQIKIDSSSIEDIESRLIKEHLNQVKVFSPEEEESIARNLIQALMHDRDQGERVNDYDQRLLEEVNKIFRLG